MAPSYTHAEHIPRGGVGHRSCLPSPFSPITANATHTTSFLPLPPHLPIRTKLDGGNGRCFCCTNNTALHGRGENGGWRRRAPRTRRSALFPLSAPLHLSTHSPIPLFVLFFTLPRVSLVRLGYPTDTETQPTSRWVTRRQRHDPCGSVADAGFLPTRPTRHRRRRTCRVGEMERNRCVFVFPAYETTAACVRGD